MFIHTAPVSKTHRLHDARRDFFLDKTGPVYEFSQTLNRKNDIGFIKSLCTVPMEKPADLDLAMLYINVAGGYANYEMVEPFAIFGSSVIARARARPVEKQKELLAAFADNVATLVNNGGNHRMMYPALDILLKLHAEPALDDHPITVDANEFTDAMRLWNNARKKDTPRFADAYGPAFIS